MFIVVVFEKKTRKVVVTLPFSFEVDNEDGGFVDVYLDYVIRHKNYGFEIFNDTEPVFFNDTDGDMCLKDRCLIVNSNWLD